MFPGNHWNTDTGGNCQNLKTDWVVGGLPKYHLIKSNNQILSKVCFLTFDCYCLKTPFFAKKIIC